MKPLVLYHATRSEFETLDPTQTVDGGLHFGTETQARMRGGSRARMIKAEVTVGKPRRSRDLGGQWESKIGSAKSAGHDAIVYLNRYEGMSIERIEEAQRDGVDFDRLSDSAFRKRVPEAEDSYIVFDAACIKVLDIAPPKPTQSARRLSRP